MSIDRRSRFLLALPVAALVLSLTACSAPRPTAEQVADGLAEWAAAQNMEDIDADAAACFAEHLLDSELSDETLNFIANGEDKQSSVADRDLTTKILRDNFAECTE